MSVYIARIGRSNGPIKIGYAMFPMQRIDALARHLRRNVTLLACLPGGRRRELALQAQFAASRIIATGETFRQSPELVAFIAGCGQSPYFKRYRTKSESKRSPSLMTKEKIEEVGRLLNDEKMSGPEVARKLGVSTASIYAHWKQVGHKKFARKKKAK